jgi:hypothetical protein
MFQSYLVSFWGKWRFGYLIACVCTSNSTYSKIPAAYYLLPTMWAPPPPFDCYNTINPSPVTRVVNVLNYCLYNMIYWSGILCHRSVVVSLCWQFF